MKITLSQCWFTNLFGEKKAFQNNKKINELKYNFDLRIIFNGNIFKLIKIFSSITIKEKKKKRIRKMIL